MGWFEHTIIMSPKWFLVKCPMLYFSIVMFTTLVFGRSMGKSGEGECIH